MGQALSPNYAPSRFYTRLYPYGLYTYIYIYLSPSRWRKKEALVVKWRASPARVSVHFGGIYRFIRRGDNASFLATSRSRLEFLLETKRLVSRSRTAATPPFREARAGRERGRRVGRKKRKRGASAKARLAPVINYRPSERPVHAPVAFFNFSPRSSSQFIPSNDLFLDYSIF